MVGNDAAQLSLGKTRQHKTSLQMTATGYWLLLPANTRHKDTGTRH